MSTRTYLALGASLALTTALCVPKAHAQFYLGPEGGWTGLEGQKSTIAGIPLKQSFDSGYNVGARAGYQWNAWRFEGEYSYRANTSNTARFGARFNGNVNTNSFMANGIYDFNVGWPVTPHIGMGIGGAWADASLTSPIFGNLSKSTDAVFAYQAIAGIRYNITPSLALDLDYRYRGMSSYTYTTRALNLGGLVVPSRTYSGNGNTNNFVASLTWLFAPPPPPMAAPPPPPPPMAGPKVFLVFFDWDKDTVTPEGMGIIQQAANAFKSGAPVQLRVTGYTDRSGSPAYNQRLSERRANNVAKALAQMGVPRSQMAVGGRGENDNRVPTADGVREPQNRRVEITF